jgi:hypothetical protein
VRQQLLGDLISILLGVFLDFGAVLAGALPSRVDTTNTLNPSTLLHHLITTVWGVEIFATQSLTLLHLRRLYLAGAFLTTMTLCSKAARQQGAEVAAHTAIGCNKRSYIKTNSSTGSCQTVVLLVLPYLDRYNTQGCFRGLVSRLHHG